MQIMHRISVIFYIRNDFPNRLGVVFLLDFYHQNRFEFFYGFFRAFQHGEFLPYGVYLYEIQPF